MDEKLGLGRCLGYSPLMSYQLSSFGGSEALARAASLLEEALGFSVSATAVQRNTEAVGVRIPDNPHAMVAAQRGQKPCELMVVEVDGTISPQILEKQGITRRESLKQPTDWKECNVVVIQKMHKGNKVDRWTGARYGRHQEFETYAGRAALAVRTSPRSWCFWPMELTPTGNSSGRTLLAPWESWISVTPSSIWATSAAFSRMHIKQNSLILGGLTCC